MESSEKKTKWLSLVGVAASIVGSMALLGYLSIRFLPSDGTSVHSTSFSNREISKDGHRKAQVDWTDDTGSVIHPPVKEKYILHRDIQKQIGGTLVTYRGKASRSTFRLDVVVLALDPNSIYSRRIDMTHRDKTFRVGEEKFELISASKLRLRIWHYP